MFVPHECQIVVPQGSAIKAFWLVQSTMRWGTRLVWRLMRRPSVYFSVVYVYSCNLGTGRVVLLRALASRAWRRLATKHTYLTASPALLPI